MESACEVQLWYQGVVVKVTVSHWRSEIEIDNQSVLDCEEPQPSRPLQSQSWFCKDPRFS